MALRTESEQMPDSQAVIADFAPLVERHQKGVWRFLRLLGCAPDEADDLAQEVFVAALRSRMRDQGEAAAAGYFRTIARRKFIELRTRQNRQPATADLDAAEAVWARVAPDDSGEAQLAALRECMRSLAPKALVAVQRFYGADAGRRNLATELGIGEHGVRNLLARARQTLRECLQARQP